MTDDKLPRDDEDFNAFIRRLHPKPKDQMTPADSIEWKDTHAAPDAYWVTRNESPSHSGHRRESN